MEGAVFEQTRGRSARFSSPPRFHHRAPEEAEASAEAAADADEADAFQPARCDVAFGSAHDGWAFRLDQFAAMYAERLGARPEALTRALWGDWSYSAKEKRVVRIK